MKVLLSAFAIAPNKGSEPGVGWNWALNMSRYHEVYVITRLENKKEIESYQREHKLPFRVFYFGIPFFEKTGKFPFKQSLYAMVWQRQVVKYAKKLHEKEQFEIVHHCTYATFKFPTRLYKLNLPLVVGPLGGGERTPESCKDQFDAKGKLTELIRNLQINASSHSRGAIRMYENANKILVTTIETLDCIPTRYREKCSIMQTIGVDECEISDCKRTVWQGDKNEFRLLYVGQIKIWKGLRLLLDIMKKLNLSYPGKYKLDIIGAGPDMSKVKEWILNDNLSNCVSLLGGMSRLDVLNSMKESHAFIFPSFHDSGAMVVMEAVASGLPTIVLDTGGPAVNIKEEFGYKINPNQDYNDIVEDFVTTIENISAQYEKNDQSLFDRMASGVDYARICYTWQSKAEAMNTIYNDSVKV